jgi:hypothetical protein
VRYRKSQNKPRLVLRTPVGLEEMMAGKAGNEWPEVGKSACDWGKQGPNTSQPCPTLQEPLTCFGVNLFHNPNPHLQPHHRLGCPQNFSTVKKLLDIILAWGVAGFCKASLCPPSIPPTPQLHLLEPDRFDHKKT